MSADEQIMTAITALTAMQELGLFGEMENPTYLAIQAILELLEEAAAKGKSIKELKWRARCSMSCEEFLANEAP